MMLNLVDPRDVHDWDRRSRDQVFQMVGSKLTELFSDGAPPTLGEAVRAVAKNLATETDVSAIALGDELTKDWLRSHVHDYESRLIAYITWESFQPGIADHTVSLKAFDFGSGAVFLFTDDPESFRPSDWYLEAVLFEETSTHDAIAAFLSDWHLPLEGWIGIPRSFPRSEIHRLYMEQLTSYEHEWQRLAELLEAEPPGDSFDARRELLGRLLDEALRITEE